MTSRRYENTCLSIFMRLISVIEHRVSMHRLFINNVNAEWQLALRYNKCASPLSTVRVVICIMQFYNHVYVTLYLQHISYILLFSKIQLACVYRVIPLKFIYKYLYTYWQLSIFTLTPLLLVKYFTHPSTITISSLEASTMTDAWHAYIFSIKNSFPYYTSIHKSYIQKKSSIFSVFVEVLNQLINWFINTFSKKYLNNYFMTFLDTYCLTICILYYLKYLNPIETIILFWKILFKEKKHSCFFNFLVYLFSFTHLYLTKKKRNRVYFGKLTNDLWYT